MNKIVLWARQHDSFSHVLMGLVMLGVTQVILAPLVLLGLLSLKISIVIGCFFVIGAYYGRERRDHEIHSGKTQYQLVWQGWGPWSWTVDGYQDFLYPLAAFLSIALIASIVLH